MVEQHCGCAYAAELYTGKWLKFCVVYNLPTLKKNNVINKMQYIYIFTMEYYAALERKNILIHSPTWMSLEDMMPSEINQPQTVNAV